MITIFIDGYGTICDFSFRIRRQSIEVGLDYFCCYDTAVVSYKVLILFVDCFESLVTIYEQMSSYLQWSLQSSSNTEALPLTVLHHLYAFPEMLLLIDRSIHLF